MAHWFDDLSQAMAARTSRRQVLKLAAFGAAAAVVPALRMSSAHATSQQLISYAPGWNLVAGPAGSTLTGASGNLYTLQPGDADYEVLPTGTLLTPCWGYWAYFPAGGNLTPGPGNGTANCADSVPAGSWLMIGNPSALASAAVAGATEVLTYDPVAGYQQVSALPPGRGAWALGVGALISFGSQPPATVPAAAAASIPTAAPAPAPVQPAPAPAAASSGCCRVCSSGCPCGASCIACRDTCHVGAGCAC